MSKLRVTHRQIEAFRAIMLAGSMTEAAHLLSVTQPAISKIISQLEKEVGFSLFERRQGKLNPTNEAYILFAEVKHSYSGLERVTRAARRIKTGTGASLRLAVLPALATGFFIQVVRRLYENGSNMQLSLHAYGSEEITDLIASGLYDTGFAITPIDAARVNVGKVLSVPSFCILPPGHHLADKSAVSVTDFEAERFIAIAEGETSRLRLDSLFTSLNVTRNILMDARWSLTVSELVQAGLGSSIVDGFSAFTFAKHGGIVRPLKENLDFTFVQVTRHSSTKSKALTQFQEAFDAEFARFRMQLLAGEFIQK